MTDEEIGSWQGEPAEGGPPAKFGSKARGARGSALPVKVVLPSLGDTGARTCTS